MVAVALGEAVADIRVAGDRFFQHLWLFALVSNLVQQPEVVVVATRVVGEFEKVAADEFWLIAPGLRPGGSRRGDVRGCAG